MKSLNEKSLAREIFTQANWNKKSFIKIVRLGQASVWSSEKLDAPDNGTDDVTYESKPEKVDITNWLGDKKHQYSVGHSSMDSN